MTESLSVDAAGTEQQTTAPKITAATSAEDKKDPTAKAARRFYPFRKLCAALTLVGGTTYPVPTSPDAPSCLIETTTVVTGRKAQAFYPLVEQQTPGPRASTVRYWTGHEKDGGSCQAYGVYGPRDIDIVTQASSGTLTADTFRLASATSSHITVSPAEITAAMLMATKDRRLKGESQKDGPGSRLQREAQTARYLHEQATDVFRMLENYRQKIVFKPVMPQVTPAVR